LSSSKTSGKAFAVLSKKKNNNSKKKSDYTNKRKQHVSWLMKVHDPVVHVQAASTTWNSELVINMYACGITGYHQGGVVSILKVLE